MVRAELMQLHESTEKVRTVVWANEPAASLEISLVTISEVRAMLDAAEVEALAAYDAAKEWKATSAQSAALQPFADKLGAPPSEVRIVEQTRRWGSCSTSTLRINWRIIQAPRSLIDYVLAHEVAHLVHEHHGHAFWATLGRILPDYEERRVRLKILGPTLLW